MATSNETNPDKGPSTAAFLLDTSAFKSLSKDELAQVACRGFQLTVPPYCFWELLCHLDEGDDFARAKGYLMKFRGVEIVDKPLDRVVAKDEPLCVQPNRTNRTRELGACDVVVQCCR
jgi:hypothetical protein